MKKKSKGALAARAAPRKYEPWTAGGGGGVLTLEILEKAAEHMRKNFGGPDIEMHHRDCPKITTGGAKACRCSGAPWEAGFEDAKPVKPSRAPRKRG